MALIKENARVAARIAVELEKLQSSDNGGGDGGKRKVARKSLKSAESSSAPLVIGGSIMDVHYRVNEEETLEVSESSRLIISAVLLLT
jgi:hypothetical protein